MVQEFKDDYPYWIAVHQTLGQSLNPYLSALLEAYGSFRDMWSAKDEIPVPGVPQRIRQKLIAARKSLEPLTLWQECQKKGYGIVTCRDESFSKELLQIYGYPCMLYYCGDLSLLNRPAVAIVGSRQASGYGLMQSQSFAKALSGKRICVVSGLAAGIDGAAHEGALGSGAQTIAVLGTGLDIPYPREHVRLYQRLCSEALVISEYPLGTPPKPWQFPQRNRIISGLSQIVLLIEARARSGALITCDLALEQGKEICALPGPVTNPASIGPLRLIQQGAKLVITPQDVLAEFAVDKHSGASDAMQPEAIASKTLPSKVLPSKAISGYPAQLSFDRQELPDQAEAKVLALLSYEPTHIDTLLERLDIKAGMIYVHLNRLQAKGLIDKLPGNYFLRI
jgi:DNA processing protein